MTRDRINRGLRAIQFWTRRPWLLRTVVAYNAYGGFQAVRPRRTRAREYFAYKARQEQRLEEA